MLHHERLRPPSRDYPAEEWNGFYETRPIVYGEDAYGFAKTGQRRNAALSCAV